MSDQAFECSLCDFFVPTTDPEAAKEIADHLRRKHPRHTEPGEQSEAATLANWIAGSRAVQRRFAVNRRSMDSALAVAARLRTATALIEEASRLMDASDATPGNLKHILHTSQVRQAWQQLLDGR